MVMFSEYLRAALERTQIEELADAEGYFASIPELPGVWGNADTEQGARDDVREALEGWLVLALQRGIPKPLYRDR
jgi:predicted RNase H-like HicB family nuclease